jgi:hypothetical protein
MKDNEIWKDIPGYEGRYQVSDLGNVKSLDIVLLKRDGKKVTKKGKIKAFYIDSAGYKQVHLYMNGNAKHCKIHRLVADMFIKGKKENLQVNHINGIKTDNRACNLEWVTQEENMKHAYSIGLQTPVNNGLSKKIAVLKNGIQIKEFPSIRELCREMNLDRRTVRRVITGRINHYKGYTFELAK